MTFNDILTTLRAGADAAGTIVPVPAAVLGELIDLVAGVASLHGSDDEMAAKLDAAIEKAKANRVNADDAARLEAALAK